MATPRHFHSCAWGQWFQQSASLPHSAVTITTLDRITVLSLVQLYSVIRTYTTNETSYTRRTLYGSELRCSFKIFPESLYFWEIKNSKIIWANFFTLHLLQNNTLVPIYTSVSDCKRDANIPWSHLINAFSFFNRILNHIISITKAPLLQCFISV
jgi:hypothetical protein